MHWLEAVGAAGAAGAVGAAGHRMRTLVVEEAGEQHCQARWLDQELAVGSAVEGFERFGEFGP